MRQLHFVSNDLKKSTREYGGSLLKKSRKRARPLSSQHALHLVLKADKKVQLITNDTILSPQNTSLRKHKNGIAIMLEKYSHKFGIKIYKYAIAGNHIHILLLTSHRLQYRAWIRTITGQLAVKFKIKWRHRPWSRVLSWGKEFLSVTKYVLQNILEAEGLITYQPRKIRLRRAHDLVP